MRALFCDVRLANAALRFPGLFCLLILAVTASAQSFPPKLEILPPIRNDWIRLSSPSDFNTVTTLQASSNLLDWEWVGTSHDGLFNYPDAASPNFPNRFYRSRSTSRGPIDDWKNQILFSDEPFRSTAARSQDLRWVKFAILLSDPVRVFYQDSMKYPFHYDFAAQRLAPFVGMDRAAFDSVSLHRANQQVLLGAVLYPPDGNLVEYGVQFVGFDAYAPEEIVRWFGLVKATVYASGGAGVYYMPTFEQSASARTNADYFVSNSIPIASTERWIAANNCYSPGWALGRMKYIPASEIDAAFGDGRLRPEDILLTDGVPANTPVVAGIISLTPATPNSHVAILSRSFGIPFVYLSDEAERLRVQQLAGHEVILRATVDALGSAVEVVDVEGALDPALKSGLLALKAPQPIEFAPRQSFGALTASCDMLAPGDIQYFGGKAANYGLLRRSIPTNCPPAIAFSFDLWDGFLDQVLPGGKRLRAEIAERLASYTNYPPDIISLRTTLAAIRDLFTHTAHFSIAQQEAILTALTVFNSNRKIRFRSSTNVEDSEHFTGAGLYDSFSGCLLDDLDGDTTGPSQCDPAEPDERGVFRAIQKVYASFYNDDAFLERVRHGVDEARVGMGVLVHHSFPDEEELANGVATLGYALNSTGSEIIGGELVSQSGATSVTNPDGNAIPEVVAVDRTPFNRSLIQTQRSSLVPLGGYVMGWQSEYWAFLNLFTRIGDSFHQFYPAKQNFYLDFEYKKDTNLGLVVKQVRQIPDPTTTNRIVAYLIDQPATYCVLQGGYGDVFANHRLKSLLTLHTANMRLIDSNVVHGLYGLAMLEYVGNGTRQSVSGPMNSWPGASNSIDGSLNYWTTDSGTNQRNWRLETQFPRTVTGSQPPVVTQRDFDQGYFYKFLNVTYAVPMPTPWGDRTNETVRLTPSPQLLPSAVFQERIWAKTNLTVQTSFYWLKPLYCAGCTYPLIRFVQTRITGMTSDAIVLTNYFSQTYDAGVHNFGEAFIFEPRLEPGLPQPTLAELNAANIQLLYIQNERPDTNATFHLMGLDGKFRTVP
jgi:hypothetical protein